MKIREAVERILQYHPELKGYKGCDDYKCGDPEKECTGIVTALTPNIHVIKEAIRLGANLIVVHEPTFYTSADEDGWFEDFPNEVYEKKRKLLDDNGIVVWRDHDHMHAHDPDAIFTGVLKYLGWLDRATLRTDTGGIFSHHIVEIEPQTLRELCEHLMKTIGMNGVRIIGDPEMIVRKVAMVGHLYPMEHNNHDPQYSVKVIRELEEGADVIIPGEIIDWTVMSYIRDANLLGIKKGAINLGHFNWEELGMKYMEDWLSELVNEIKVTYVASTDMYDFVTGGNS